MELTDKKDKKSPIDKLIDAISAIFLPIIPILSATGILKGLIAIFTTFNILDQTSGTFIIFQIMSDAVFYFFPFLIAWSGAKRFNLNIPTALVIAGCLMHPSGKALMESEVFRIFENTAFESIVNTRFLGMPVVMFDYSSTIIPMLFATFFAAKVELFFKKRSPESIKSFLVPLLTIIVTVPITFILIGPATVILSGLLGDFVNNLIKVNPILASIFLGAFWQPIVILGLHWGIIPLGLNNIAVNGFDTIIANTDGVSFAQLGALIGVYIKTKNKKTKKVAVPAGISAFFGVTEPSMYGVTIPLKIPFIMSCLAGALGAIPVGIMKLRTYSFGALGIFSPLTKISPEIGINQNFWGALINAGLSLALGFVLTFVIKFKEKEDVGQLD